MLPAFRGVQAPASADAVTLARLFNELVGQLRQVFARLLANASLDDVRVTGVVLTGGADTTVTHKLGRQPQEWRITDISAAATVFGTGHFRASADME